jgi:hypothetical protein
MRKCLAFLLLEILAASIMLAQSPQNRKIPELRASPYVPLVAPGWYDWIYDPGVPAEARIRLEPLYQDLDYLQRIRIPVVLLQVQERAWDFLAAGEEAVNSKAEGLVAQSATGRTQQQEKQDTPESLGWNIGSEIRVKESQINAIRHQYGLDLTIGPAPKPFNLSSVFNADGVKNWLAKTEEIGKAWESAADSALPSEITFDPSTLSASEYAGWLANQKIMRAETLGQSDPEIQLQELRRQAAQADSDLNDAQQQYEIQTSQGTYRSPISGDVAVQPVAKPTAQNPSMPIYPAITPSSQWQSPQNYRCANGPCTLQQWQQESTSKNNPCSGPGCAGSQIKAGANGQMPASTSPPRKPPQPACQGNPQLGGYSSQPCSGLTQPAPASGGDDPLSHAWLCQQLASIMQYDKNSLAACRPKDQLCIQMFQAAVQGDLKNFNANKCDAKLLH